MAPEDFLKEKFLRSVMPTHSGMVFNIQQRTDYTKLSLDDLLSLFVSRENFAIAEEMHLAQCITTKTSLALKATQDPIIESNSNVIVDDHEDEDYFKKFSKGLEKLALMVKGF